MINKSERESTDALEIGGIVYLPGKRPIGFYIIFSVEALFEVGVLKKILTVFENYRRPIVNLHVSTTSIDEPPKAYIVVDMHGSEDKVGIIKREIQEINFVEKVEVFNPLFDGLLASLPAVILSMAGSRCIIFRKPVYEAFIKSVQNIFGLGGAAILYHLGIVLGRGSFRDHKKMAGNDRRLLLSIVEHYFRVVGYGILEIKKIDENEGKATLRVYKNFECELHKGSNKPKSQYTRGILAGWFQEFFGRKNLKILETRCIARGDPYCEYEIF